MRIDSPRLARAGCVMAVTASVVMAAVTGCQPDVAPKAPTTTAQRDSNKTSGEAVVVPRQDESSSEMPDEPSVAAEPEPTVPVTSGDLAQQLYARHCAACHGAQGDGRGFAAAYLFPKPRDIQTGRFRLVSTSNNVPSREDLHAVLLRGMPGSSMPPWGHLPQAERDALVDEVMRLRVLGARAFYIRVLKEQDELTDEEIADEDIQEEIADYVNRFSTPGESTMAPEIGEPTEAGIDSAKETYAKFGCLQCHGKDGKGDGVQKMVDDEGYPTAPRDFTAGIFKGGADPASLYRRIAYGMPGTPMPSSQQMSPEQMVDLVHYIRSMSTDEQRRAAVLNREQIVAPARSALPGDVNDAAWSEVPAVSLRMTPLWWRNNADPGLQVQAVHDGQALAVRLSWTDATPNWHAVQSEAFEDAIAIELYRGDQEPFIGMGDPRWPVDVWFWDADRQTGVDVEDQYPNVVVDLDPFSKQQAAAAESQGKATPLADQADVSLPALAVGNQITPGRAATGGSHLAAGGPGTATFRLPRSQLVSARGSWQDGRWTVVMTRAMATPSAEDGVSLEPGSQASIAFAVWDGSAQDRNGKKLITVWQDFRLEP